MTMPGMWELLVIFGIVLLLFGAKRLPDIASGMGGAINNFKRSMREGKDDPEAAPAESAKIDDSATQKVPEQMAEKATTTSSATS